MNPGLYCAQAASKQPLAYDKAPSAMGYGAIADKKKCLESDTVKGYLGHTHSSVLSEPVDV